MTNNTAYNAKIRGFDPGDDDKLQKAISENLKKVYEKDVAEGKEGETKDVKKELDALKEIEEIDKKEDPEDKNPDDENMG